MHQHFSQTQNQKPCCWVLFLRYLHHSHFYYVTLLSKLKVKGQQIPPPPSPLPHKSQQTFPALINSSTEDSRLGKSEWVREHSPTTGGWHYANPA